MMMEQPDADGRQQSMDNYTEDYNHEKPACEEERSPSFNQLPLEVLGKIFSCLSFNDRKNVRPVCSSFYEACSRNENVHIRNPNQWEEFQNCRLNNMNVTIDLIDGEWNPVVWKEVGARMRSLHMNTSTSGCGSVPIVKIGLENVIMFCDNLQTLRIALEDGNPQEFCSPSLLQEINILRNKLERLIIQRKGSHDYYSGCCHDKWMEIYIALLRIFPNVLHYTSGWLNARNGGLFFSCSCSVTKPEFTDRSELASGLALMLSGGHPNCCRALSILSKLRFSVVSFVGPQSAHSLLEVALRKFFEEQKALVSGKMKQGIRMNFTASEEHAFETSVIQRITSHWASIYDIPWSGVILARRGCQRVANITPPWPVLPHSMVDLRHLDKAELLQNDTTCYSRIELSDLNSELPNLDEALFHIHFSDYERRACLIWKHRPGAIDIYPREMLKRHESIECLILVKDVSDKMLQTIFQFLTRLKSLVIRLGQHNTCFGLTGSPAGTASHCSSAKGYSIKSLQQLETLWIFSDDGGFSFDDSIFDEFDFPKLSDLASLNPKELMTLRNLILRLPALKQVAFHTQQVASFLDVVCSARENPIFISFEGVRESFSAADRKNFFDSYSSLKGMFINDTNYFR